MQSTVLSVKQTCYYENIHQNLIVTSRIVGKARAVTPDTHTNFITFLLTEYILVQLLPDCGYSEFVNCHKRTAFKHELLGTSENIIR